MWCIAFVQSLTAHCVLTVFYFYTRITCSFSSLSLSLLATLFTASLQWARLTAWTVFFFSSRCLFRPKWLPHCLQALSYSFTWHMKLPLAQCLVHTCFFFLSFCAICPRVVSGTSRWHIGQDNEITSTRATGDSRNFVSLSLHHLHPHLCWRGTRHKNQFALTSDCREQLVQQFAVALLIVRVKWEKEEEKKRVHVLSVLK